jgi:hypothetical protein
VDLEKQIKQIPDGRVQVVVEELLKKIKELEEKRPVVTSGYAVTRAIGSNL